VRSVAEAYMHLAGAGYFLSAALGQPVPEGLPAAPDQLETLTAKEQVVAVLKDSLAHGRKAVVGSGDLDRKVPIFGGERTARTVVLLIAAHLEEHLGQSIAYARVNGVVPPWSAGGG
jgi:hypothetical protein